jgi:hypothetical protein
MANHVIDDVPDHLELCCFPAVVLGRFPLRHISTHHPNPPQLQLKHLILIH